MPNEVITDNAQPLFQKKAIVHVIDLRSPFLYWTGRVSSLTYHMQTGYLYGVEFLGMPYALTFPQGSLKDLSPHDQQAISLNYALDNAHSNR
jgi:hypothetical protein